MSNLGQWHHARQRTPGRISPRSTIGTATNIANAFGLSSGTASPDQYLCAQDGTRLADDVVLTNVIGFDVKVWEPAANRR